MARDAVLKRNIKGCQSDAVLISDGLLLLSDGLIEGGRGRDNASAGVKMQLREASLGRAATDLLHAVVREAGSCRGGLTY